MATNLFEKYGIKDVADVTIYRIEKKEQTYESQRKVSVASVLKGAVELRTVYPMQNGKSTEDGFEAYVFTDAEVITGTNYDCDDVITANAVVTGSFTVTKSITADSEEAARTAALSTTITDADIAYKDAQAARITAITNGATGYTYKDNTYEETLVLRNANTKQTIDDKDLEDYELGKETTAAIKYSIAELIDIVEVTTGEYTVTLVINFSGNYAGLEYKTTNDDISSGAYEHTHSGHSDPNKNGPGTHEYSYEKQAFMLFAKRQNLIAKTGARYNFSNEKELMNTVAFEDLYSLSPNSSDKAVVLGLASSADEDATLTGTASWTDADYDVASIDEALGNLTTSFTAKAYDVVYNSYAELVVNDEMGYYNPNFLGTDYDKKNGIVDPSGVSNYTTYAEGKKGIDLFLAGATMWGKDEHYSINDAIDALRQQQKILDADDTLGQGGIVGLYGGYRVTDSELPTIGQIDNASDYIYMIGDTNAVLNGERITSKYSLTSVLDTLTTLATIDNYVGKEVEADYGTYSDSTDTDPETTGKASNRAIYVKSTSTSAAATSHIYLLHNRNYRRLTTDKEGIFTFVDKKGNKVYYQDRIFAGIEYLALVVIGTKGMIFVVNRHGENDVERIAWMVSDNGFINDSAAAVCVSNGLIHTTDITTNNETFEATCAVKSLKVRTVTKTTNRYVPVLFLDTLKVSTIEQTAEDVYATGGHGNSNLIGWDFGKEITLSIQDALFTPASMSAILGSYEGNDFRKGVKETKTIDRTEKVIAPRSFIVPAGNQNGTPTEADKTAQAVYIDLNTMEPYPDGTPIAEGETYLKWTRSIAYEGQSLGKTIEISADKFPGTYKIVGDTFIKAKDTGEEQRFQFVVPQAKFQTEQTITLEADGDPSVFDMNMTVLKPDDGVMVRFIQYDVVENSEENDGSTMVKGTENLNLLDDAELYRVDTAISDEETYIGATEY